MVYLGFCDPIVGPVTPGNPVWYLADLDQGVDAGKAAALLAGLGSVNRTRDGILIDAHGRPVRFTLLVEPGSATRDRGAAFIRDELKKIGIGVDLVQKGSADATYGRVEIDDTDPAMSLDVWITPSPATDWQRQLNALMLKVAATSDRVERLQRFAEAQRLLAQHMPAVYLGAPYVYVATSPRVLNAKPSRQRPSLLWDAEALARTGTPVAQ